jgi:hypothetical protein
VVMGVDVQIQLKALSGQLVLRGNVMVPAVVQLDYSEVLARYLGGHIFNIDPKSRAFQHRGSFN